MVFEINKFWLAFVAALILCLAIQSFGQECDDEGFFFCENAGYCIPPRMVCDGWNDCEDRSDEVNCTYLPCKDGEWQCSGGACIPDYLRCDYLRHCEDDEANCPCEDGFECLSDNTCVPSRCLCDRSVECDDFSDEANCTCNENEIYCGRCIKKYWLCDYIEDCPGGIDELNCNYTMPRLPEPQLKQLQLSREKEAGTQDSCLFPFPMHENYDNGRKFSRKQTLGLIH